MEYRDDARKNLDRFYTEFQSGDNERLKYAVLELRMALEAITYDRALAYQDEFPKSEYETWQPVKVMDVLLEIDPSADHDCSIAIGIQDVPNIPAINMQLLGHEKVLSMKELKKHYHALGHYLHAQSLKQRNEGTLIDYDKRRSRCGKIAQFVQDVLSSPIFNVTCGNFTGWNCDNCGNKIRKRMIEGDQPLYVECQNCNASYILESISNNKVQIQPDRYRVKCSNKKCEARSDWLWKRDLKEGMSWHCSNCNGINSFVLRTFHSA